MENKKPNKLQPEGCEAKRRYLFKNNGSAIALVVIVVAVLSLLSVSLLSLGQHYRLQSIYKAEEISSKIAADAGLTKSIYAMNQQLQKKTLNSSSLPGEKETLPLSEGSFKYVVTGSGGSGYQVESTGHFGHAEKKVKALLRLAGLYEYAIYVKEYLELKNDSIVDSFNLGADESPLQIATLSTIPSIVDLRNSVTIDGEMLAGFGADPDEVVNIQSGVNITGGTSSIATYWDPPIVAVPEYLSTSFSKGEILNSITLTTDGKYDRIKIGNGEIITIDGNVSLYITGTVFMGTNAQIKILDTNPDAKLTLYLGDKFDTNNGATINNMTKDPKRLSIFGQEGCEGFELRATGQFYGTIYVPNADVVFHNSLESFGAVVAKSFINQTASHFHYDASLRKVSIDDIGVRFVIHRWSEE